MKVKSLVIISIIFLCSNIFAQSKFYEMLIKANKEYEQGEFTKAIQDYKFILQKIKNGYLYYNIGTCYLKLNKIGASLFYYKKAKFLIPLNKKLNKNILIAKSKVKDDFPERSYLYYLENIFLLSKICSMKLLFWLTVIFFYFSILFAILLIIKKKKLPFFIFLFIFIFVLINFIWSWFYFNRLKFGYITTNNVSVYNDFSAKSYKLFTVNDGTKIYVLEKHGKFLYVLFSNGVKGWVLEDLVIYNKNG